MTKNLGIYYFIIHLMQLRETGRERERERGGGGGRQTGRESGKREEKKIAEHFGR